MRILLVEDEKRLSDSIKQGLVEDGYAVDQAFDGEEGLYLATNESYDSIILDILLPKMDGLQVCKKIRIEKITTPILMLTAKVTVEDISAGLNSGADDYLKKPFSHVELKARIQALIRRNYKEVQPELKAADLILDPVKHTVRRANMQIDLTPKEFSILEFLLRHKNEVVTRTMITEHVWDYNFDSMSNVVDVFITTLRKKINQRARKKLINTVHGIGFKLTD
ncbi:DNA-binding response regulator [Candidatus Roizmanbacteria bacterium RIFCSPLOWO2_02_FULL_38_10]|uniref:DNA-binding response regulator n=1 Tax=Candidatus Roizmanbacteria bacterium RIFCSPLOWO2_02_FULL_38_10 TaxID=1802074 RepID=A0A1F7JMB8_9BACT|nr:MAG: DNA-binding response regulator [Candidatus Roizmanbacteria bacterium RIFCSPLOWO2_02_FULL_38_10]